MKLSEYLLYRDIQELNQMATFYACECNRNSKLELVQSIHHHLFKPSLYTALLVDLEPELSRFYTYILFHPSKSFSLEELIAKGKYIGERFGFTTSPRKWISHLLKRGWLFPSRSSLAMQFDIPDDLQHYLRTRWIAFWLEQGELSYVSPSEIILRKDEGQAIVHDIFLFLQQVEEQPYLLTIDGTIHKRQQEQLFQKLSVQEQSINDDKWRFGYGRRFPSYPARFALLYDFCFDQGFIVEEYRELWVTSSGTKLLTNRKIGAVKDKLHGEIIHYWRKRYAKPIPALPFLCSIVTQLASSQWVEVHNLFVLIQRYLQPYYYDDEQAIYEKRCIAMLVHLGLLEKGVCTDGKTVLRATPYTLFLDKRINRRS